MNDEDIRADSTQAGRDFIQRDGRLLERRIAETIFDGAPADAVVDALSGYQNTDGGFGHALEPDTRCPASLAIYTEIAFQALAAANATNGGGATEMVLRACDHLQTVSDPAGLVSLANPVIEQYSRAAHWTGWTYQPGLNPTAGLAGLLFELGVEHPWLDAATTACWSLLDEAGVPGEAHALAETLHFLAQVPDRDRAMTWFERVRDALPRVEMLHLDPATEGYGVTPLGLAPSPASPWRALFTDDIIDGHLRRLRTTQQTDGGWPVAWEPPGNAALIEWRGIVTLRSLTVLSAYG